MRPEFYRIPLNCAGQLWIMPRPRDLDHDIARYCDAGMQQIVSMLAPDEAAELGLRDEGAACAAAGLGFTQHAIPDFGLPDMTEFATLVSQIKADVEGGQSVGVHCRAGIGRSGMVTCGVLVSIGYSALGAISEVSKARGIQVPDTLEQAGLIASFEKNQW